MGRARSPLPTDVQDRLAAIMRHYGNNGKQGRGREQVAWRLREKGIKLDPMTIARASQGKAVSKKTFDALTEFVNRHDPVEEFTAAFEHDRFLTRVMIEEYGWDRDKINEVRKYLADVRDASRKLLGVLS